jgi:hypothetical protein
MPSLRLVFREYTKEVNNFLLCDGASPNLNFFYEYALVHRQGLTFFSNTAWCIAKCLKYFEVAFGATPRLQIISFDSMAHHQSLNFSSDIAWRGTKPSICF